MKSPVLILMCWRCFIQAKSPFKMHALEMHLDPDLLALIEKQD